MARFNCVCVIIFFMLTASSFFSLCDAQVVGCPFDSIYNFGDTDSSTSDGGLQMIDHLSSSFHLPSPNSYTKKGFNLKNGATFAAKGATVLNLTFFLIDGIDPLQFADYHHTLEAQSDSFTKFLDLSCSSSISHEVCMNKLKRALVFVNMIDNNDYKYAFLQGKSINEVARFVLQVTQTMKDTIKKLIVAGATHLLIPGSLPMGCMPGYLTLFHKDDPMDYDANMCHRGLNTFARLHNDHLQQILFELRRDYPNVQIVYADYYNAFISLLRNHVMLGFRKHSLLKACCGSGGGLYNFDPTKMCGADGVSVCSDPSTYLHWNGFHLTQEAQRLIVQALLNGKNFLHPEFEFPRVMHCIM